MILIGIKFSLWTSMMIYWVYKPVAQAICRRIVGSSSFRVIEEGLWIASATQLTMHGNPWQLHWLSRIVRINRWNVKSPQPLLEGTITYFGLWE